MKNFKDILEATTLFSRMMGKPNDGMADLLTSMEKAMKNIALSIGQKKKMNQKLEAIDNTWDNLWDDIVNLAKEITKAS